MHEYLMVLMRALDEAQIFDDFEKVPPFLPFSPGSPLYKGQVAREGEGSLNESPSRAVSTVFKVVSSKKGSKGE